MIWINNQKTIISIFNLDAQNTYSRKYPISGARKQILSAKKISIIKFQINIKNH